MDLADFIGFAKKYNNLGWSVQNQLDKVLDVQLGDCNPNALEVCREFLNELAYGHVTEEIEIEALTAVHAIDLHLGPDEDE